MPPQNVSDAGVETLAERAA